MLTQYKNTLYQIINEFELNPEDFRLSESDGKTIVQYTESKLEFVFIEDKDSFHRAKYSQVNYNPGLTRTLPSRGRLYPNYNDVFEIFKHWLSGHVKVYQENNSSIDLWAELQKQKTITDFTGQADDQYTPFTDEQKRQIRLGLNEVKLLIQKEFKPSEDEMKVVADRLDYLANALDRLNKFDWKGVLVATVGGIATALSLDPEKAAIVWNFFKDMLERVVPLLQ